MRGFDVIIGANTTGFEKGVNRVKEQLSKLPNTANQATTSVMNLSRVIQDSPYGFIGLANNINPLLESFQRLRASSTSTGAAMKAFGASLLGGGGLGLAVAGITTAITFLTTGFGAWTRGIGGTKSATDELDGVMKEFNKTLSAQAKEIDNLSDSYQNLQRFAKINLEISPIKGADTLFLQGEIGTLTENVIAPIEGFIKNLRTKQTDLLDLLYAGKIKQKEYQEKSEAINDKIAESEQKLLDKYAERNFIRRQISLQEKKDNDKKADDLKDSFKKQVAEWWKYEDEIQEAYNRIHKIYLKDFKGELRMDSDSRADRIRKEVTELGKVIKPDVKIKTQHPFNADLEEMKKRLEELIAMGKYVGNSLANAFGQAFDRIAEGQNIFKSVGEALKDMILQLIKAAIQAFIVRKIIGLFAPGLGSIGNLSAIALGGNATGGPMAANRPRWVGERGPEVFMPSTAGRIVPNNQLGSLAGSAVPVINFYGRMGISMGQLKYEITKVEQKQSRVG